ncbi:hypothetical protein P7K49_002302 [Saguinus oedipus]|uniref:Uncharacterized protein n=1 Tax=Saguinus oedipus TaxID=9490 RepID=A0ABQ9WGZ2_SAGOE|nr:hypothetical protein P7K49_002302 [Saguinus oedipus]
MTQRDWRAVASPPGDAPRSGAQSPRVTAPVLRTPRARRARPPGGTGRLPARAPAQLTRRSPPRLLRGACRTPPPPVGLLRVLGAGSQRPALGWQRLLQPPEPALQLRSPRGSTWATRKSPSRDAPPTQGWGGGVAMRGSGEPGRYCPSGSHSGGLGGGWSRRPPPRVGPRDRKPAWPGTALPGRRVHGARGSRCWGLALGGGRGYHVHLTGGLRPPGQSPARASCDSCLVLQ